MEKKQNNPMWDLVINLVLPLFILNKGGEYLGPQLALIIATLIPLVYGAYDYVQTKKINFNSVMGFVGVILSGGLGLIRVDGYWFAIKEAAIPLLIGVGVLISAFTKKPLISMIVENEAVMDVAEVNTRLESMGTAKAYKNHLKTSTIIFSLSFFLSAILNYVLAKKIFLPISTELSQAAQDQIRNTQIADMQWKGMLIIMLPCLLLLLISMVHVFRGIKKYTGLSMDQVIKDQGKKA